MLQVQPRSVASRTCRLVPHPRTCAVAPTGNSFTCVCVCVYARSYPESAYYFNAGPYRGPTSGLTVFEQAKSDAGESLVSFYKLHHRDPIFFNDGFKFQWRNGDITDAATGEKCTSVSGNPIGTPSAANVTTLVYAYTW